MDSLRHLPDAYLDFIPVYRPVSQTGAVVVPFPEPAVVQYKKLYAHIRRIPGNGQNLLVVKVKVSRFPAVKQYRPDFFPIRGPAKIFPENPVINMAKPCKAAAGPCEHCLRSLKFLSRIQQK